MSQFAFSTAVAALFLVACGGAGPAPRPISTPPAEPPPTAAPQRPASPEPQGGGWREPGPLPQSSCEADLDCPPGQACVARLIAACPVCDGGTVVRSCEPAAHAQPEPPPPALPCPGVVNCMPGPGRRVPCLSPELIERCPNIITTH
jgi:hypothetical protein